MTAADRVMVVLNVPPGLEESMIDWLLGRNGDKGFTTYSVSGHSSEHAGLSAAEQVSGRRKRLRFEVEMPRSAAGAFLGEARDFLGAAHSHCVVYPILASGSLSDVAETLK